ncbi:MAG: zf-HC2 domain-containing protein [Anaerolineales bacterium]|jgi:hypothetical protein
MNHLTENQLNEYLDGLMEASALAACEEHLSDCADCQSQLAVLQSVFQALAALPEANPQRDLAPSVLKNLSERGFGLGWRLALAMQAGLSLGLLVFLSPVITDRITDHIAGIMAGWAGRLATPEVRIPNPIDFHFTTPAIPLFHPPTLALPISITQANSPIWLILGIAALALFVVGNFSLVFHSSSKP